MLVADELPDGALLLYVDMYESDDSSESERSRRAREAKARLERDRRDEDGFEYIDDPQ